MRVIPKKNYFFVALIVLVSFLGLWYTVRVYEARRNYEMDQNKRMNILSELKEEELQNYILDNHDVMIYFSSSRDNTYESFERKLIRYLKEEDFINEIVYVDTSTVSVSFYDKFVKYYVPETDQKKAFTMLPNMFILTDGKVSQVLYTEKVEPNVNDVKSFLDGEK